MTPDYVFSMVRRRPPVEGLVVEGSTPVVAFGDPTLAEVATLGINPSPYEFLNRSGGLLAGSERRLATLESLGADSLEELTDTQVAEVVADCATYFQRLPYKRWFDPLDRLLRETVEASYYDGSACHLDLVQWATDPIWSDLSIQNRPILLDDGVPHLRAQLQQEHIRLVILNGASVIEQVQATGLAELEAVGRIRLGHHNFKLVAGAAEGVQWRGWSANLQAIRGNSDEFREQVAAWLRETARPSAEPPATAQTDSPGLLDPDGYLQPGLRVDSKSQLVAKLRRWLDGSQAPTLGHVGTYGGRPCIHVQIDHYEIALNADTTREAIETFVRDPASAPEGPWRVVANRHDRINKVIPGSSPIPGWYAYLTRPTDHECTI
jgi:hypothetical protein